MVSDGDQVFPGFLFGVLVDGPIDQDLVQGGGKTSDHNSPG